MKKPANIIQKMRKVSFIKLLVQGIQKNRKKTIMYMLGLSQIFMPEEVSCPFEYQASSATWTHAYYLVFFSLEVLWILVSIPSEPQRLLIWFTDYICKKVCLKLTIKQSKILHCRISKKFIFLLHKRS